MKICYERKIFSSKVWTQDFYGDQLTSQLEQNPLNFPCENVETFGSTPNLVLWIITLSVSFGSIPIQFIVSSLIKSSPTETWRGFRITRFHRKQVNCVNFTSLCMAGEVKRELDKEEKPYKPLDEQDINILKFQNPYAHQIIDIDKDVISNYFVSVAFLRFVFFCIIFWNLKI